MIRHVLRLNRQPPGSSQSSPQANQNPNFLFGGHLTEWIMWGKREGLGFVVPYSKHVPDPRQHTDLEGGHVLVFLCVCV